MKKRAMFRTARILALLLCSSVFGQALQVGGSGTGLPAQSTHNGQFLQSDGSAASWVTAALTAPWTLDGSGNPYVTGVNVGIGTNSPQSGLHVSGRNVLFEEGNVVQQSIYDVGYKIRRLGTADDLGWDNPAFEIGRIYKAGVGLPAWTVMCSGTANTDGANVSHSERICESHESSGTNATINFNARISGYESYIQNYSYHPWFRLNASPDGRLQMGAGGAQAEIGQAVRTGGNLVTVHTGTAHKFIVGATIKVYPACSNCSDPIFCPSQGCTYTVASATDGTHFTYADTDTNGSNTVALAYSSEVDVEYAREANSDNTKVAATTVVNHHPNWRVWDDSCETDSNVTMHLQGPLRLRLWFNGGGQSQLNDNIFLVNSGGGDTTSTLPSAAALGDGYIYLVKNTAGNHVTVASTSMVENIDGSATKVMTALQACWFISASSHWWAVCSP